jgi:hypothetical protein
MFGALPLRTHVVAALGSFVFLGIVNSVLNANYAASNHPVSYAEGQTTFDGAEIKGFYAVMEAAGTLDRYWVTQFVDFAFIAAMILLGVSLGSLLSRLNRSGSFFSRAGRAGAVLVTVGALFDVVENLLSFVLLANPQGFANWLAVPYSSAAVIKFICIGLGMALILIAAVGVLVRLVRRNG